MTGVLGELSVVVVVVVHAGGGLLIAGAETDPLPTETEWQSGSPRIVGTISGAEPAARICATSLSAERSPRC